LARFNALELRASEDEAADGGEDGPDLRLVRHQGLDPAGEGIHLVEIDTTVGDQADLHRALVHLEQK